MIDGRAAALRSLLLPAIATLAAIGVLIGLGTWQLNRLSWKEGLVAQIAARTAAAPKEIRTAADIAAMSAEADEYRRLAARGRFAHDKEVQVYTILGEAHGRYDGAGYWVVTPLLLDDGSAIIVNRGFVPPERRDPASRPEGQPVGEVTVTGLLRAQEQPNMFTPANDPAHSAWFTRDPIEIARAAGLGRAASFTIDADATANPGGLPQGGETRIVFPNRHLEYALTWYGLALGLAGVFMAFAVGRIREAENPDLSTRLESGDLAT